MVAQPSAAGKLFGAFLERVGMKVIKLFIALLILAIVVVVLPSRSFAYPPFVAKAKKFGAKDCTFCHVNEEGGEPYNERGVWLRDEKERRKADVVDVEWLADYKPKTEKDKPEKRLANLRTK